MTSGLKPKIKVPFRQEDLVETSLETRMNAGANRRARTYVFGRQLTFQTGKRERAQVKSRRPPVVELNRFVAPGPDDPSEPWGSHPDGPADNPDPR